jgi:hypothetical protein
MCYVRHLNGGLILPAIDDGTDDRHAKAFDRRLGQIDDDSISLLALLASLLALLAINDGTDDGHAEAFDRRLGQIDDNGK